MWVAWSDKNNGWRETVEVKSQLKRRNELININHT